MFKSRSRSRILADSLKTELLGPNGAVNNEYRDNKSKRRYFSYILPSHDIAMQLRCS